MRTMTSILPIPAMFAASVLSGYPGANVYRTNIPEYMPRKAWKRRKSRQKTQRLSRRINRKK